MIVDIIILGSGVSGITLALAVDQLSQGQIKIALLETLQPSLSEKQNQDRRGIALSYWSCQQLQQLGFGQLLTTSSTTIDHIHISNHGSLRSATLSAHEHHLPYLGRVIELGKLRQQLWCTLSELANIILVHSVKIVTLKRYSNRVSLKLSNGITFRGKLFVSATGINSDWLGQLGIKYKTLDYHQYAITTSVIGSESNFGYAFERFIPSGSLALLPLSANCNTVIWCHNTIKAKNLLKSDDSDFIRELQNTFGWRLGELSQLSRRQSYPLHLRLADRCIGHRLALIGNCAQTLHPITAQGLNLALRDVVTLAHCLVTSWNKQIDIGAYSTLTQYQINRQPYQRNIVNFTDGLLYLLNATSGSFNWVRKVGLTVFNSSSLIKNSFLSYLLNQH